jgi:Flp pilus assembly protein TadB
VLVAALVFVVVLALGRRPPRYLVAADAERPVPSPEHTATWAERPRVRMAACAAAGAALGLVVAGVPGLAVGALAGVGLAAWVGTLEPAHVVRDRARVERDLPLVADLLAACAESGAPVDRSLALIAAATDGPLARRLTLVAARIELGASPASQWRLLAADPALGGLARTLERAAESGAPPADGLARLAGDCRRRRRAHQLQRARAVGVRSAAPLALCFLPAFMLVGVVPTVVGAFGNLPW